MAPSRGGGGGGGGGGGCSGLVGVGRDVPVGLNIANFLGPTNPFGQQPARLDRRRTEEEVMRALVEQCGPMAQVLSARLNHLKVVSALWAGGVRRALEHMLDMDDTAVMVDVLAASQQCLALAIDLDLALDLMPALRRLVDSS